MIGRIFLTKNDIGYVVRSTEYPSGIREPLEAMEKNGELIPVAQIDVQNFQGMRLSQDLVAAPVVIFRVRH